MSLLAGIAEGLGSLLGAGTSAAASAYAVKKQIAWERERAHNAHQWEVQDLKNAGLNPILSAGGSGALTGGISMPMPDTSGISNAITSAFGVKQMAQEIKNAKEQNKNIAQDTLQKKAQTDLLNNNAKEAKANAELAQAQLLAETPKLMQKEKFNKSKVGKVLNYIGMGAEPVGQAVGALTNLGGLAIGTKAVMNSAKGLKETMRHNAVMEQMKTWPKVQIRNHNR